MKYEQKTFTLPASGKRKTKEPCKHSWRDSRNKCVLCGEDPEENISEHPDK